MQTHSISHTKGYTAASVIWPRLSPYGETSSEILACKSCKSHSELNYLQHFVFTSKLGGGMGVGGKEVFHCLFTTQSYFVPIVEGDFHPAPDNIYLELRHWDFNGTYFHLSGLELQPEKYRSKTKRFKLQSFKHLCSGDPSKNQ